MSPFARFASPWSRAVLRGGIAASALVCAEGPAIAQSETPLRIEVSAPPPCPAATEVFALVRERSPHVRQANPGEPAYAATVAILRSVDASVFRAHLHLVTETGAVSNRRLEATNCLDLERASALVVSLDLPAPAEPSPPSAVASEAPREERVREAPLPGAARGSVYALMTNLSFRQPFRDGVALGAGASIEVAPQRGASPWTPAFRAGASYAAMRDDTVSFRMATIHADACAPHIRAADDRVVLMPCLRAEIGLQTGVDSFQGLKTSSDDLWLAPGALGRARARVVGNVFVEVEGGAVVPLVASTVVADRRLLGGGFYGTSGTPGISWLVGLAAGVSLP